MSSDSLITPDIARLALGSLVLIIECLAGGSGVMAQRKKYFTEEFLGKFGTADKKPAKLGYPDMGNGHYADKLPFEGWFNLNIAQRIHGNFQEWIPIWLLLLWISAISFPKAAVYLCIGFIVSRFLYLIGYKISPNIRGIGAMPYFFLLFASIYTTVSTLLHLLKK